MKKVLLTMLLAITIIFIGSQNNFAEAVDYYVGNESNGDKVYLITENITKTPITYSQDWKKWSYKYYLPFKSVNPQHGAFYFGYTITCDFDEPPMYKDQNGKLQPIDFDEGYLNDDPNVNRARILHNAYKYLLDHGYME